VAVRALALDITVRQEHLLDRVVELLDRTPGDQVFRIEMVVDVLAECLVLRGIRGVVVVECHMEAGEVAGVLAVHAGDQLLRGDAFLVGAQHDRRAVGVVGADVIDLSVGLHSLEAHPDIGLDVFHEVAEVDAAVGVRQRRGDEDPARHFGETWKSPDSIKWTPRKPFTCRELRLKFAP
jgi:hypothetical protein